MGIRRVLAGLAAASILAAPAAQADTLASALASAYRTSGLLEQNRALLRAADEDVAQSVADLRPIIQWSADATQSDPYGETRGTQKDFSVSSQISASMLLYDFGATDLAIEAQKEVVLATREDLRSVEQNVLLRAVEAYAGVRGAREVVDLRQNNVRVITEQLRASEDRFEVGEVTRTDVSLAEAQLASARSELVAAQGDLAQAEEEYRAVVGNAPQNLAQASPVNIDRSKEGAVAYALRNHPDILSAQHSVASADLSVNRAKAAQKPRIDFNGRMSFDEEFNSSESVGVGVNQTLYQGGALSSQIRQAMAQRDQQRSGLYVTQQDVQQQVGNAFARLQVARATLQASDDQIRAAQTAFNGVRDEAELGTRTTLDVLDAEQDLLDARATRISAQADLVSASYAILASMGLMTADYLGLGVQTYDPAAYYDLVSDAPAGFSDRGQALDRVLKSIGN